MQYASVWCDLLKAVGRKGEKRERERRRKRENQPSQGKIAAVLQAVFVLPMQKKKSDDGSISVESNQE